MLMEDEDDMEEIERAVFASKEVSAYQIPPQSSSLGHKAEDWKKCILKGPCRVMAKGKDLSINITEPCGTLFAACKIPGGDVSKYVEPVADSSRYFVLKVTNGQRHAFIGMGFEDRNAAFDFKCALSDFQATNVGRAQNGDANTETPQSEEPSRDLSLQEGQSIRVNLKVQPRTKAKEEQSATDNASAGLLLAPPPASTGLVVDSLRPAVADQVPESNLSPAQPSQGGDLFDDFVAAPPALAAEAQPEESYAPSLDPLVGASALPAPVGAECCNEMFDDFVSASSTTKILNPLDTAANTSSLSSGEAVAVASPCADPKRDALDELARSETEPANADPFADLGVFVTNSS